MEIRVSKETSSKLMIIIEICLFADYVLAITLASKIKVINGLCHVILGCLGEIVDSSRVLNSRMVMWNSVLGNEISMKKRTANHVVRFCVDLKSKFQI